jgi:hypothetical protein
MNIEEWNPEPRPSLPPPKPVRKWRTILGYSIAFTGIFVLCVAVLGRQEIAAYFGNSAKSPPSAAEAKTKVPNPDKAAASAVRSAPDIVAAESLRKLPPAQARPPESVTSTYDDNEILTTTDHSVVVPQQVKPGTKR